MDPNLTTGYPAYPDPVPDEEQISDALLSAGARITEEQAGILRAARIVLDRLNLHTSTNDDVHRVLERTGTLLDALHYLPRR